MPDPILCATRYEASGTLARDNPPVVDGSCDAAGTWTVALTGPMADADDHPTCDDAPTEVTFEVVVAASMRDPETGAPVGRYLARDAEARSWTVSVSDKGGSCSGAFSLDVGQGTGWSWHVTEASPG